MTELERLTKLVKEALSGKMLVKTAEGIAPIIAEHLLANGVIAPPCKVGDTVYVIYEFNEKTIKICDFIVKKIVIKSLDIRVVGEYGEEYSINECYLTKEEAERALKERNAKNEYER